MLAATKQQTIPAAPGPGAEAWTCRKCERPLGWIWNGWWFCRHHGRDTVTPLPVRVQCERCGRCNIRDA